MDYKTCAARGLYYKRFNGYNHRMTNRNLPSNREHFCQQRKNIFVKMII